MEQNQIQEIPPEWRDLIVYEEMEVPPESEDLLQSLYDDEGEIVEINNKCCDAAADLDLDVDLEMDDDNKAGNEDDIENFATIFDRDGEYIWPIFLIEVNKFPPLLESLEGYHRKALCKTFQARLAKKTLSLITKEQWTSYSKGCTIANVRPVMVSNQKRERKRKRWKLT
ncbi:uncharacterized protein LOC142229508 [Haematobia irritans]|uniref:uncharacterized protein LOC142229508 n=1 Tax=Haematobia irritans TaxID=7368 RepID=UPI003F50AE40